MLKGYFSKKYENMSLSKKRGYERTFNQTSHSINIRKKCSIAFSSKLVQCQIAKSNRLWLRGSNSLKLNPFLKCFFHFSLFKGHLCPQNPGKEGMNQVLQKWKSLLQGCKNRYEGRPFLRYLILPDSFPLLGVLGA